MRSILALALACVAAGGCSRGPATNLLLIVSDTLRADALACYGGRARTPHLCGLAARGALFERAYSAAPWTAPSAVALFTGSHPGGYADRPPEQREQAYHVPDEERLLADVLVARGYTARFDLDNGLAYYTNALQGFEGLDVDAPEAVAAVPPGRGDEERAARMGASLHFLASAREPFLAMRWILDPHAPYGPPPERLGALAPLAEGLPHPLEFYAGLGHHNAEHRLRKVAPSLAPAERRLLRALYDEEVSYVDERVGWLFAELDRRGLWERTLVVFTSDHGEAFGEHGLWLHGKSLHEGLLRVPLIVAGPGVPAGLRVAAPVSLVDLLPTLCERLGVPCPEDVQGTSFAGLLTGGADAPAERAIYAGSSNEPANGLDALIVGHWKLVAKPDGSAALYDLAADPGEERDLAASRPEELARLAPRLAAIRADNEARRARHLAGRSERQLEQVREQTRRGLEALGYVE